MFHSTAVWLTLPNKRLGITTTRTPIRFRRGTVTAENTGKDQEALGRTKGMSHDVCSEAAVSEGVRKMTQ